MHPHQKKRKSGLKILGLLAVVAVYCAWTLVRPLAPISPSAKNLHMQSASLSNSLAWPATGQAAVGSNPSGVLALHGTQKPVPIASTAKVLTALCVLKKKPLAVGKQGPTRTLSASDVAIYNRYVAGDGSVTPINEGEQLTQYQMLQAILLPSANNIADSLAIWAFGSLENYALFANNYIRQIGLTNTHVGGDASGYDPSTVSTAHDLVLLGEAAMQEPVLAQIVGQKSAELPVAGTVMNVNSLLGTGGIVGIKTGNTDQAGGVFLAAKNINVSGKPLVLVTAVVGTDTLYNALVLSLPLLASAQGNFAESTILPKGSIVGKYVTPWGKTINAVTALPLKTVAWKGSRVATEVYLKDISPISESGHNVGRVTIPQSTVATGHEVPIVLSNSGTAPSTLWRLTHPLK